ncbi:hypothetical protein NMK34_03600 [Micromonospora sp. BRA006-A]|uniref:hypothetical protein n=1 Tax=Micromonospora sp. BRA006-A TaxID=2962860 RepID=UPI00296F17DA|nr:hypothetical protein [Micromonospora sp. BRA006-A]MDW3845685.1 hypothetical protein [Micromonospora sp. BRA006-A]MEE3919531.1 hypothetical protein [Micromonospora sp. BRA006-A]
MLTVGPATLALSQHTFPKADTGLTDIPGGTFDIVTVNGRTATGSKRMAMTLHG